MRDVDFDALTDEDIFVEASERLKLSDEAEGDDRANALEDLAFDAGEQWDTDMSLQRQLDKRPSLTINHTHTVVQRVINTLKQQRPRIKCHPISNATIDDAKVVNGLIRHIETLSNSSVAYDAGGTSAIKIGWGYWRINSEYCDERSFDQEIKILPIGNTFTVYDDPSAQMPAGEDRDYCLITEVMKRTEYKRKYPDAENVNWETNGAGDVNTNWESKEEIRLAEYYRIVEKKDTLYQLQDGSAMLKSEFDMHEKVQPGMYKIAMQNGKPVSRPSSRRQVQWFRLNGKKIVDRRELPGRYIPVIKCRGNVDNINGEIRHHGMIRDLKDPARMYNYWRTAETERYALAPKAPWVMAEGQADGHPEWDDANQKTYSRLVYKPTYGDNGEMIPPPIRQQPVGAETGMAQAAAGAEHDLTAIAGMMPENPQERAAVVSGNKYLARRQGMADLVHWHYYDNQTYSIMFTGIMLLDLIPYYYDMPRMQRIVGDDGLPQMVGINQPQQDQDPQGNPIWKIKNNLTIGKYDVVMDTGPGYQTKREENAESMIQLLSTPLGEVVVKTGADVVLRNMDFNGADTLADRAMVSNPEAMDKAVKELPEQAQNIIGAMQAQLKQATETIQQQAQEIKFRMGVEQMKDAGQTKRTLIQSTERAHATETTAKTADENSRRDYAGWREEVHVNANVKKDVAEIGAAASLLNTRAEAEANDKAADKMIAAGAKDRVN